MALVLLECIYMRSILLIISLLSMLAGATEWIFNGFVRLNIATSDLGMARIFNIPTERFYQTRLGFRTESKSGNRIEIVFTEAKERFLNNNVPVEPQSDLADNLIGRRIILQKTGEGLSFYDDPDHILNETLPFDINMLCLMLELSLLQRQTVDDSARDMEQKTLIWSMPYVNQDKCRVLERLMATVNHVWGENQIFSVNINRDEVLKENKRVITGTADGLGDGVISRGNDGSEATINLTVHLDKSLLVQEPDQEGRLGLSEEQDFVLESKP
jgi:hypothetical protein